MPEKFPQSRELKEIKEKESEKFKFVEVPRPDKPDEKFNVAYEVFNGNESQKTPKDKKTIFVLSGWGGSLYQLEELAEYLAKEGNKRVVVLSNLGTGKSSDIPDVWLRYKHRDFADEAKVTKDAIEKISAAENLDAREYGVSLVGYSMGSILAASIAEKNPELVKDLILVHPAGFEKMSPPELVRRAILTVGGEIILPFKNLCMPLFDKNYEAKIRDPKIGLRQIQDLLENFSGGKRLAQRLISDWWPATQGYLGRELPKIKSNILIMTGSDDKFLNHNESEKIKKLCELSPRVSCEHFENLTHVGPIFHHEDYVAGIKNFLTEERRNG